jgi:hypothetical protein
MLVSSANRTGFNGSAVIFGRSFILIKKNKRPSIEHWGRPCFILPRSEKVVLLEVLLFISTHWYLSLRYDLSSALVLPLNQ